MKKDFKSAVVYQIYPKSFRDTNGDGLGDLRGVIEKLDYIKTLGADYIWLTPFFVSPQKDNGYDVEDYYNVDPRYGSMADLKALLREASARGISLMFDMVFNHVSSRHEWFRRALSGDPYYKDFFFFRKGKPDGSAPTNWESKFGGSAWEYVKNFDEYYLHLFDVSQPDLNWDNPNVRKELQKVIRFWMQKGVKGFRFDVINLVSKDRFEDDPCGDGRRFYTDGPNIHAYLKELNETTFGTDAKIITVGEMSSTSIENCYRYAGEAADELSMVFSFHHLKVDFAGNEKWVLVPADFMKLKHILFEWQTKMAAHKAWNAVFWCNHDQPRVVSRFGNEAAYWKESAKMLATVIHGLRGTPYIYQGEELGMTNAHFTDLSQYRDVESINHFRILQEKGLSASDAMRILQIHSRDNSRTPMQWDDTEYAGFTDANTCGKKDGPHTAEAALNTALKPWISVNPNHKEINAAQQLADEDSIFHYYRKLIALRKAFPVIACGGIEPLYREHPQLFAYRRGHEGHTLYVLANFYGRDCMLKDTPITADMKLLIGNYADSAKNLPDASGNLTLRPYEAVMWYH